MKTHTIRSGAIHNDNFLSVFDETEIVNIGGCVGLKKVLSKSNFHLGKTGCLNISYCENPFRKKIYIHKVNCNEYLEKIMNGEWEMKITQLRKLYSIYHKTHNKKPYTKEKNKLPVLAFSGVFIQKFLNSNSYLKEYTQYIILDIDQDDNPFIKSEKDVKDLKEKLKKENFIYSVFISPSGYGLKLIVKGNQKQEHHNLFFQELERYFKEKHKINLCNSGSNINRFCFVSYDPDIYINLKAEIFEFNLPLPKVLSDLSEQNTANNEIATENKIIQSGASNKEILDNILSYLNQTNNSITNDYNNWITVGFALVNEFKNETQTEKFYFHKFSKLDSDKYDYSECEKTFIQLAKDNKQKLNLATIIYLAKAKGYEINNSVLGEHLPIATNNLRLLSYGNYFKERYEIDLFEFFVVKSISFKHQEFYQSLDTIINETKIKRNPVQRIINKFIEIGILNRVVKSEIKGFSKVSHYIVNYDRIMELYPNIYNTNFTLKEKKKKNILNT